MEFVLNRRRYTLDAETVTARVKARPPDEIRKHWVQIGGRRWPVKQALRAAMILPSSEYFVST